MPGSGVPLKTRCLGRATCVLVLVAGVLILVTIPRPALAHSLGGLSSLPAPLSYFLAGVATVLIATSALLTVFWRQARWQDGPTLRPFRVPGWRGVVNLLRFLGLGALLLVVLAGLVGVPNSVRNPAPVLVWVAVAVAVPFASALIGNIYHLANPWRTLADFIGLNHPAPRFQPAAWGVWPATIIFGGLVWFELVYPNPAHPRHLAIAAVAYTVLVLGTAEWLGQKASVDQIDALATYNRLFSAISPIDLDPERGTAWRGWLRGLPDLPDSPGQTTVVVVMIGAVAFHGISAGSRYETAFGGFGRSIAGRTLLLVLVVAAVGMVYWLACSYSARQSASGQIASGQTASGQTPVWLASRFAHALVPIAFAYVFSHYFTAVVFEGQLLVSTISDPFGLGWNLFGTALRPVDFTVLSPAAVWWTQVASIVAGHVAGLVLIHDRSLRDFNGPGAVRGRYALLFLVVFLAAAALTILAVA